MCFPIDLDRLWRYMIYYGLTATLEVPMMYMSSPPSRPSPLSQNRHAARSEQSRTNLDDRQRIGSSNSRSVLAFRTLDPHFPVPTWVFENSFHLGAYDSSTFKILIFCQPDLLVLSTFQGRLNSRQDVGYTLRCGQGRFSPKHGYSHSIFPAATWKLTQIRPDPQQAPSKALKPRSIFGRWNLRISTELRQHIPRTFTSLHTATDKSSQCATHAAIGRETN